MTGSLQAKNGYLYAVITYNDELGNKRQKWISTGLKERGNRKAAKAILETKLEEFEKELENKKDKIRSRREPKNVDKSQALMLFSDYCSQYVESIKPKLTEAVYYVYKNTFIKTFKKYFDKRNLRLIDVTDAELRDFFDFKRSCGVKNSTIKHYNCILRPALRKAFKDNLIPDNPFDNLEPISREKCEISYYDQNEMQKFLTAIRGNDLEIPFMLAAYYGLRRSEVLGLRWQSVDFTHKIITINHKFILVEKELILKNKLKTNTSYRTLPLLPAVEEKLLEHKAKIEENKKFFGNTYDDRFTEYICVHPNGKIIYPDHMTKKFSELLKENGLKHIRLHDLRHSCASNMLASGVPMKEIQEWLGACKLRHDRRHILSPRFQRKNQSCQCYCFCL